MKYLTLDEIKRLDVCIDSNRDRLLIQMGLVMGCRVSEIVNIKPRHISKGVIKIWDEKKDQFREIVIDQETQRMITDYIAQEWTPKPHEHHKLFYFSTKTANRIVKHWFKKAGIPADKAHWHTLRHTFVVQSLDAGMPLNHVCQQTGDSPITIISIYGKPSLESRKAMLERAKWYAGGK